MSDLLQFNRAEQDEEPTMTQSEDYAPAQSYERKGYEEEVTDNLADLLNALPPRLIERLRQHDNRELVELVLDLGRKPEARYDWGEVELDDADVTREDLEHIVEHIGNFGEDNRAGIERTLHRISAIRNRAGIVVGLTCRIGRAVFGTIAIIQDLVESGESILILGRPGVGKTTILRETARVLADSLRKRVVIVDTSNEIAGDGDIPHPAIGRARRMQVPRPSEQHAVMIEAVENHMPQVIVIDEIGTELESQAARTIAERGVQLIGTAHGNTLENLMLNPTLSDLIGGIQSVTLSDEEARRRGTQKSVLERKAPPTFTVLVEIQARDRVAIHRDIGEAVDAILRTSPLGKEVRQRRDTGELETWYDEGTPNDRPGPGRQEGQRAPTGAGSWPAARYPSGQQYPDEHHATARGPGGGAERRDTWRRAAAQWRRAPQGARHRRQAGALLPFRGEPQPVGAGDHGVARQRGDHPRSPRRGYGADAEELLPPPPAAVAGGGSARQAGLRPAEQYRHADGDGVGGNLRPAGCRARGASRRVRHGGRRVGGRR